jgi:tetratricopeptide (TPR) repeat protein
MTGSKVGHYEVGEKLGAGGMGEVYRARDTRLLRNVALKFLPPALGSDPVARARFLREAQAASALEHPNIQAIYDIGEHDDRLYIAMALYEGETLHERMRREPMPVDECVSVIRQLIEAIGAAHGAGIVHRDLKPANVILTRPKSSLSGSASTIQVKVVDFGLAKLHSEAGESRTHLTEQGALMGTVAYMSPEQARGDEIDARTDLWAIGVMAYEVLAGKHPFEAPSHVGTLTRIATEDPRPLEELRAGVPPHLRRFVVEMLRKKRDERVPDAAAALELLLHEDALPPAPSSSAWTGPAPVPGAPPSSTTVPAGEPRPWTARIAVGVAVAVVAAAAAYVGWFRDSGFAPGDDTASVVVLPCQIQPAGIMDFLEDGVPRTLTTLLGQVPELDTRRPPASQEMKAEGLTLETVARAYGVRRCFTCDVLVQGDTLQLNVQLVELPSLRQPWTGSYTGSRETFIDLIQRAARQIRDELVPGLTGAVPADTVAANSGAEVEFRRGQYHAERYNDERQPHDLDLALSAFNRALQLDETLGAAAAEIALLKLWHGTTGKQGRQDVQRWVDKALALDPNSHRAWTVKAFLTWGDTDKHEEHFAAALESIRHGPDDGLAHWPLYGFVKIFSNDLSLTVVEQATAENPLYAWGYVGQASALFQQGRLDQALARLEKALEFNREHYAANAYKCIFAATVGKLRQVEESWAVIEHHRDPSPPYLLNYARFARDFVTTDGAARQDLMEAFHEERCTDFQCLDEAYRFLTPLLLRNGEREEAIQILESYVATGVMPAYDWLMFNPDTLALLAAPRMEPIRSGAREQYETWRDRLNERKDRGELPEFLVQPLEELEGRLDAL